MEKKSDFECEPNCYACCVSYSIPISKADFKRLLEWKEKTKTGDLFFFSVFSLAQCEGFSKPVVRLKQPCRFLSPNGCIAYAHRPLTCRMYPFEVVPLEFEGKFRNLLHSKDFSGTTFGVFLHHTECPAAAKNLKYPKDFLKQVLKDGVKSFKEIENVENYAEWFKPGMGEISINEFEKIRREAMLKLTDVKIFEKNEYFFIISNGLPEPVEKRIVSDSDFLKHPLVYLTIDSGERRYFILRLRKELQNKLVGGIKNNSEWLKIEAMALLSDLNGLRPEACKIVFGELQPLNVFFGIKKLQEMAESGENVFKQLADSQRLETHA